MKSKRLPLLGLLAVLVFALPLTVFANKQIYKAKMVPGSIINFTENELANGSVILGVTPGGVNFMLSGNEIEGVTPGGVFAPVFGRSFAVERMDGDGVLSVHIHGPASETETGPVVVTLCGNPAPAVYATCDVDEDGHLKLTGAINPQYIIGMNNAQFMDALSNGLLYVEAEIDGTAIMRGQLYPK